VTGIFCGKLSRCPASGICRQCAPQEIRATQGFLATLPVKRRACMTVLQQMPPHLSAEKSKAAAENKRPDRGDNRSGQSHMGAWGGWALAPNIANGEG
jgi:hypothetical protein